MHVGRQIDICQKQPKHLYKRVYHHSICKDIANFPTFIMMTIGAKQRFIEPAFYLLQTSLCHSLVPYCIQQQVSYAMLLCIESRFGNK
jgi:hypothetical protein